MADFPIELQRKELERLCRYITRPAIANKRLKRDGAGDVVLQLKSAWRDGTTHIRMSPLEFMQRLHLHLIRFHGVLAPNAGLRAAVVLGPPQKPGEPAGEDAHGVLARFPPSRSNLRQRSSDERSASVKFLISLSMLSVISPY